MTTKEEELQDFLHTDSKASNSKIDTTKTKDLLAKLSFSPAAQNLILDPNSFNSQDTGLTSIASSNELLIQVRNSLTKIIDSIEDNPSMISRLTKYWGSLTTTEKIIGGVAVTLPILMFGFVADIGFLLACCGLSAATYITSGAVLEDHLQHTQGITEKLKAGILGIADVLVLTISALDAIRQKLATEVDKFKTENMRLSENINSLSEDVDNLRIQIESSKVTEQYLRKIQAELEELATSLQSDLTKNQQLYDKTQLQIQVIKLDHEHLKETLSEQILDLSKKRAELEIELEKSRCLAETLQGTVTALSTAVIRDSTQRQKFQDKLEVLLQNKETNFLQVADRMSKAEAELTLAKERFEENIQQHTELMKRQRVLLNKLEHVADEIPEDPLLLEQRINNGDILTSMGFMSLQKIKHMEIPQSIPAKPVTSQKTIVP